MRPWGPIIGVALMLIGAIVWLFTKRIHTPLIPLLLIMLGAYVWNTKRF